MSKDLNKLNENNKYMLRTKKNFMTLLKVYNGCVQKKRDKDICLQLAYMFLMAGGTINPVISRIKNISP